MERQTIVKLLLLLDPCHERLVVPKSKGCRLATQRELKVGPFARQEVLHRPGSLLVAQREEGHKTQLPGVQVAVWLDLAEPTPESSGRVQSSIIASQ